MPPRRALGDSAGKAVRRTARITTGSKTPRNSLQLLKILLLLVQMPNLCLKLRHVDRGEEFLASASKTVLEHDIDLASLGNISSGNIDQGFSVFPRNDADEMRAAFSHLIYIGTAAQFLMKKPLAFVDVQLLAKFNLLMSTRVATHLDINFMIRYTYTSLHGTSSTAYYSIIGPSSRILWFERYWKLIDQIHSHIGLLQPAILKVSFIPDYHSVGLVLKLSTIIALTALVDLHAAFAPSHSESSRRYRDALIEIVNISSTFTSNDFQYLTPVLSEVDHCLIAEAAVEGSEVPVDLWRRQQCTSSAAVGKSSTGDIEAETWTRADNTTTDGGIKMDKRLGVEVEDASMKEWGRIWDGR
ncbi:hypothetical protein C8J57DRAFT_1494318 [Mycena rebaudengoi]|nr:hypothetical protein C8J57DRAFT_1494318 [Mycena rebaudengoi]